MSDLREALEVYPEMHGGPRYEFVECAIVEDAARRLLEAEEAGTRLWCESHEASTSPGEVCWAKLTRHTHLLAVC